ncbi:unnamed protein product, partial [Effrenium voratum]
GKNELDGEVPSSNATELLPGGGPAKARRFAADASGAVTVSWPEVDWQSLVGTLGGHEVLEWQARALGAFKASGELTVGCWGVTSFSIGNRSFVGDLYRAGLPPHPVELPEGGHRISLRLRGKLQAQFACEVERGTEPLRLFGGLLRTPSWRCPTLLRASAWRGSCWRWAWPTRMPSAG